LDVTTQRLERIMSLKQGCRKRTPWWCWLVMLMAACVSLPGAALVTRAQEQAPRQQSNSMKPTDAVLSTLREAPSTPAAENTDDRDESPMQRKLATKISVD